MTTLVKVIKRLYDENSRFESGPPIKLIKELEHGSLVLSDYEVSDEDIPVLSRFFRTRQACEQITRIEINKTSGCKVNKRRTTSALNCDGSKLFRELIDFIARSKSLEMLTFDLIEINLPTITLLGRALAETPSKLRWLAFRSCDIRGDEGLKELTPHIGKMELQVLGLECCKLTDRSLTYLASVVKAQENNLDSLFWNATLRLDQKEDNANNLNEETRFVYSCGLLALSLWGNQFTGKGILELTRLLRKNYWLLGLNFAENKIDEIGMAILVDELKSGKNELQSVLLRNNPGLDMTLAKVLCESVVAKAKSSSGNLACGYERLNILPPRVSWLLRSWMRLQCEETRDLIQGRVLMNFSEQTMKSSVRKASTRESPQEAYLRSYSVFTYLDDPEAIDGSGQVQGKLHPHPAHNGSEPVLYDFPEVEESLNFRTASSSTGKHTVDRYGTATSATLTTLSSADNATNTVDLMVTSRRVVEPHHDLLFRPVSTMPLRHGFEYDESVDASVDVKKKKKHVYDDFDRAIAVQSPPRNKKNEDKGDAWGYWPEETQQRASQGDRPPSRISIRPNHRNGFVDPPSGRKGSPVRPGSKSMDHLPRYMLPKESTVPNRYSMSQLRQSELGRAKSPVPTKSVDRSKPAWCPSNAFAHAATTTRMRARSADPAMRASTPVNPTSVTPVALFTKSNKAPKTKTSKQPKTKKSTTSKSKQATIKNGGDQAFNGIAASVLAATKNLEQVSQRLRDVAESLSESALMNVTNLDESRFSRGQTARDSTPTRSSPSRYHQSPNHNKEKSLLHSDDMLFPEGPMDNVQLTDLVRQRMYSQLHDILTQVTLEH